MKRKAKIVATIGPASDGEVMLERLIKAGVNVARLNFSHGTHKQHAARITAIRAVAEATWIFLWVFFRICRARKFVLGSCHAPYN